MINDSKREKRAVDRVEFTNKELRMNMNLCTGIERGKKSYCIHIQNKLFADLNQFKSPRFPICKRKFTQASLVHSQIVTVHVRKSREI